MKKTTIYIVLALLCLNFWVRAQDNKAVDVTLRGIQIGQKVPDITITNLHNYRDVNGKTSTTAKLSDFKGKLLILDFWATWCSPCIAMIPKMDSLQKAFGDKIQFLSVTYQTEKEVLPFLAKFEAQQKKHYDLPVITADKELHQLFPHIYLPHYVWIDEKGTVVSITRNDEVTKTNIENTINKIGKLNQKRDLKMPYDPKKPFLINGNGGQGDKIIFHSILSGHQEGLAGGYDIHREPDFGRIRLTAYNLSIVNLYRMGFLNKGYLEDNRTIIAVNDPENVTYKGEEGNIAEFKTWAKMHTYCYELILPIEMDLKAYENMRNHLATIFPDYKAAVVKRTTKSYVLRRTSTEDKIKSIAEGPKSAKFSSQGFLLVKFPLYRIIQELNLIYQQRSPYPLVDETNYKDPVDIKIDANLTDMASINKALIKYDLQFELLDREIDFLVISDNRPLKSNQ